MQTDELKADVGSSTDPDVNIYSEAPPDHGEQERIGKGGFKPYLYERKQSFAAQLNDTAQALRQSGNRLPGNGSGKLVRLSAEKLDSVGSYLERHEPEELIEAFQGYARAKPWRVIGGALVVGLAAARFLKASSRSADVPS